MPKNSERQMAIKKLPETIEYSDKNFEAEIHLPDDECALDRAALALIDFHESIKGNPNRDNDTCSK